MTDLNAFLPDDHPAAERAPPAEVPAGGGLNALVPDDHPAEKAAHAERQDIGREHANLVEPTDPRAIRDEAETHAPASMVARANLAPDPKVQLRRYAAAFGQPESDFIISGDKIARKIPGKGHYAWVEPKEIFAGQGVADTVGRAADWAASGAGQAIPVAIGAAGTALGAASPMPGGAILGGASGGVGGEMLREGLDRSLAGDKETPTDWENVGWQGLGNAMQMPFAKAIERVVPELTMPLRRLAGSIPGLEQIFASKPAAGAVKGLSDSPIAMPAEAAQSISAYLTQQYSKIKQVMEDAQKYGLNLSLGQISRNPTLQRLERFLAGTPEGADAFTLAQRSQSEEQVPAAVRQFLDEILPENGERNPVSSFREAADKIKGDEVNKLQAKANVAFGDALADDKGRFWTERLDELMQRPSIKSALGRAKVMAEEEGIGAEGRVTVPAYENGKFVGRENAPDWRTWDRIRKSLNDELASPANTNPLTGRLSENGRLVYRTKQDLMGILKEANPDYATALEKYGEDAQALQQLLKGGVGTLNKFDGPDRMRMITGILGGGEARPMPHEITQLRNTFEKAGKLDEWNGAVRFYVENALDGIHATQSGDVSNAAGKMYQRFWGSPIDTQSVWSPSQKAIMKAAIGDPAKVERWDRFGQLMRHAAGTLPEGSPTGANREFEKATTSNALQWAGDAIHMTSPKGIAAEALKQFGDRMQSLAIPEMRAKVTQFLLSPDGDRALKRLMSVAPANAAPGSIANQRAQVLLGRFLENAGVGASEDRGVKMLTGPGGTERP